MKYRGNIVEGTFLSRPNRFIAFVKIGDKEEKCHVKNTGRCKELLVPGCKVYLEESDNPNRSTRFDLIATEKKEGDRILLINMDSQAPNRVVEEWLEKGELFGKKAAIKREVCFGESRFDFSITEEDGRVSFLEVKGCTLEKDGVEVINPVGEAFDSLQAQAVQMVEDTSVPDETVAQVFQKGYKLGIKVIRPAMVIVATGGPKREKPEEESE